MNVNQSTQDPFSVQSKVYDFTETNKHDINFWAKYIRESNGPILEIGIGTGRIINEIKDLSQNYIGIDISESMLSRAKIKLQNRKLIELKKCDILNENVPGSFSLIIAPARVFEHVIGNESREHIFNQIAGMLNDYGKFVLYVWNKPKDFEKEIHREYIINKTNEHTELIFKYKEIRYFEEKKRFHEYVVIEKDGLKRQWNPEVLKIQWYEPNELDALGVSSGLTINNRFQNFNCESYVDSLHLIWEYLKC
jgi:SAM-dependent methyltransferase